MEWQKLERIHLLQRRAIRLKVALEMHTYAVNSLNATSQR